jgi:hypothetical protein
MLFAYQMQDILDLFKIPVFVLFLLLKYCLFTETIQNRAQHQNLNNAIDGNTQNLVISMEIIACILDGYINILKTLDFFYFFFFFFLILITLLQCDCKY